VVQPWRGFLAAAAGHHKVLPQDPLEASTLMTNPSVRWSGQEAPGIEHLKPAAGRKVLAMPPGADLATQRVPESLTRSKQWCYAFGQLGWSTLTGLVGMQLVFFYVPPVDEETGRPIIPIYVTQRPILVVLNIITLLATAGRIWDAITDPLIAGYSDRLRHPRGRRIPCMAVGGLPSTLCCILLFLPVVQGESAWNVVWLALVQLLFFLSISLYITPYFSLVPELGHTAQERLELSTWISVTYALGTVLAAAAPTIGGVFSEDAASGLRIGIIVVCAVALACMYVPICAIDERRYCMAEPSQQSILAAMKHCLKNPHFRPYMAADFSNYFAIGIITTGMPYYQRVLLQVDNHYLVLVMVVIGAVSFLFYYPTYLLASRFGKKGPVMGALAIQTVVFLAIFFLGWLPLPGTVQIFLLGLVAAIPIAVLGVLPNSILSDITALDTRQTGVCQEGMYFAARGFILKLGQSVAVMVFASLTNFGKDVGNDLGIRLSGLVGLGFAIVAMVCFSFYKEHEVMAEETCPPTAEEPLASIIGAPTSPGADGKTCRQQHGATDVEEKAEPLQVVQEGGGKAAAQHALRDHGAEQALPPEPCTQEPPNPNPGEGLDCKLPRCEES